ncbi:MAG: ATP-binding protein [Myxococcota bacterium]
MGLRQVIGHERVVEALVAANARGTVHHALLFAGPDGVGKRRVALGFVALVNCTGDAPTDEAGRRVDACGTCRSCRRILAELEAEDAPEGEEGEAPTHPDVLHLSPQEGSRQIRIDPVREILRVVPFPPIEAACRFVVVDPADTFTDEAANALLKNLEEPPSRTRFILLTSRPDALLTTIRSRCQKITFGRLEEEQVVRGLVTRQGVGEEEAGRVAGLADGSLGAAIALLDDPVMGRRDEIVRRIAAVEPGRAAPAFAIAADLGEPKDALPTVFEVLRRLYRDLLLLRTGAADRQGLSSPHLRQEILEPMAARYGVAALLHRLDLIDETERGVLRRNLNARLSMERLMAALTAPPGREGASTGAHG